MADNIQIRNFQIGDIGPALQLAGREGWITGIREFFHILSVDPEGSFILSEDNNMIGCITTYSYPSSAWIGNFIVAPEYRKMGHGTLLFQKALNYLQNKPTVFLNASPMAIGIYKKYGFQEIGLINRWQKDTPSLKGEISGMKAGRHTLDHIIDFDRQLWQDDRTTLLSKFWSGRNCFEHRRPYGYILFGKVGKFRVIGPWGMAGKDIAVAEKLLKGVFNMVGKKETLVLDVPKANMAATALLTYHGFNIKGTSTLMYKGVLPNIDLEGIFALGSLGSIG